MKDKVDSLGKKLEKYAEYASPAYVGADKEANSKKYYSFKQQYDEAQKRYNEYLDKKAGERAKDEKTRKTFVNSYGEATTRYITSQTYERARKRMEKAVRRNMGDRK